MSSHRTPSGSLPGEELLKNYRSWIRRVPELQKMIKDPKWSHSEIRNFSKRIENMLRGIETFERMYPKYTIHSGAVNNARSSRTDQINLFD